MTKGPAVPSGTSDAPGITPALTVSAAATRLPPSAQALSSQSTPVLVPQSTPVLVSQGTPVLSSQSTPVLSSQSTPVLVPQQPALSPQAAAALRTRYAAVCSRLDKAVQQAGRASNTVRLLAVSKTHDAAMVRELAACGQRLFGESYVQEAVTKQAALADLPLEWHFIGHVQTNKAKDVSGRFALLHTVDSVRLAEALVRRFPATAGQPVRVPVLIQVNIGDEPQKAGVSPPDLPALVDALYALPQLRDKVAVQGLMCLPPRFDDGVAAQPFFALLRTLRDALEQQFGLSMPELSMGMSGDFVQAVAEGSTLVRIGTDIFGPRPVLVRG